MHVRRVLRPRTALWRRMVSLLCGYALLLSGGTSAAESRSSMEALWREQTVVLVYRSMGTRYRCVELESRVRVLLTTVGTRSDIRIDGVCTDYALQQRLTIQLASPVEATPANLAEVARYDPTRALLETLRGQTLRTEADIERFPAERQRLSLRKAGGVLFTGADCMLVRSIKDQIFPSLSVHVVRDQPGCELASRVEPRSLMVDALVRADAGS
jgi:hypothetical protein